MSALFPNQFDSKTSAASGAQPAWNAGKWLVYIFLPLVAAGALIVGFGVHQYNGLQWDDERVNANWQNVLNQYSRRAVLIPGLVTIVQSYAAHESALFKEITDAYTHLAAVATTARNNRDPHAIDRFQEAQNNLSAPLSRLLVVSEQYPELKASELYRDLMVALEGTENRISHSRQGYIDAVADYNFEIRRFPTNLIANQAGYKPRPQFTVAEEPVVIHIPKIDMK